MIKEEGKKFEEILTLSFNLYHKPEPERDIKIAWWLKLREFELLTVSNAFDTWIDENKSMPTIAGIAELCKAKKHHEFTVPQLTSSMSFESSRLIAEKVKEASHNLKSKKRDYRAWAHKLVNDEKNGIKVNAYALERAKETLNLIESD